MALTIMLAVVLAIFVWSLLPIYDRFKWRRQQRKVETLSAIIIPIGVVLGEEAFKDATGNLNEKIKARLDGELNNIRSITTSKGPDGMCYITAWYKVKAYNYNYRPIEDNRTFMDAFKFGGL